MATVEGSDDVEVCRGADVLVLLSEEERDGLHRLARAVRAVLGKLEL
jgi:hypothetical protein